MVHFWFTAQNRLLIKLLMGASPQNPLMSDLNEHILWFSNPKVDI